MDWATGITTAPRDTSYLPDAFAAFEAAGWSPEVFNDADKTLGPWGNWLRSATILSSRKCDAILLIQDDTLLAKNLRPWLDRELEAAPWWPGCGLVSLYICEKTANRYSDGWFEIPRVSVQREGSGACAIAMPVEQVKRLLANPPHPSSFILADLWLKKFCWREKLPWIEHRPSLSRHIGRVSSLRVVPGEKDVRDDPAWSTCRHEGDAISDLTMEVDHVGERSAGR